MTNPRFVRRMIGIVVSLIFLTLLSHPLLAGGVYYTDTDNEDNAGSGVADNDVDAYLGRSDANAPIEFNINVSGDLPTTSAVLTVRANDVDEEQGEIDNVSFNGTFLEKLTGTDGTWSTTAFMIDPALVVSGNNLVEVEIDVNDAGWRVTVDWAQLLIDGGAAADGDTGNISITDVTIAGGTVTIDTQVEVQAITGGNYILEINLIDPDGNAVDVLSDSFTATAGETLLRDNSTSYDLSGVTGVYEIQAQLFHEDGSGFMVQQDIEIRYFYHEQNVGPTDLDNDGLSDSDEATLGTDPDDTDSDGDGVDDATEVGGDVSNPADSDGDGIIDALESSIDDADGDGTVDQDDADNTDPCVPDAGSAACLVIDLDDDNDGIPDTLEGSGAVDTDGDGIPDSLDLDSDNDGLFDLIESGGDVTGLDSDNDGVIDAGNSFGSNRLADALETTADSGTINYTLRDTDNDTIPDFRDLDSDGDGQNDVTEAGGSDPDEDGLIGSGTPTVDSNGVPAGGGLTPSDYDSDGTPDYLDSSDTDSDGVVDSLDLDLDNDGIPNTSEGDGLVHSDSDGIPDSLDLDADGDGLFDIVEAGGTDADNDGQVDGLSDSNADGLDDSIAASPLPLTDSNSDGTPDFQDATDSDGDGLVDTVDLDDDNDGILDSVEGSESVDTDADGVPDSLDLDSDNDGLFDLVESGAASGGLDSDNDGRIDSAHAVGANGIANVLETSTDSGSVNYPLLDSDSDGVANFRDLDSDGDGLYDLLEAGGTDSNNDGRIDGLGDADSDGLHDAFAGSPLSPPDSDSDTVANYLDLDSDNDGLYDVTEAGGADDEGDGLLGSSPQSVNSDGVASGSGLAQLDSDSDGVADLHDLDSDNDGIPDVTEVGGTDGDGDGQVGTGTPAVNAQGVTDAPMVATDTDGDHTPNQLDTDADGDGLLDIVEGGGVDSNADGRVDGFTDGDGDGLDDPTAVTPLPLPDMDGDGIADFLDNDDQDNDGVPDTVDLDLDNDGIPNDLEGNGAVDSDADGIADIRDLDSDNDGLHDLYESGADSATLDADGDGRIDGVWSVGGNGIADTVESSVDSGSIGYNGGVLLDTDSDSVADFRDLDSDNDGLYDVTEGGGSDADNDGLLGSGTPAVNGDGEAPGSGATAPDSDGDGVADQRDLDSDNDGVADVIEAGGSDGDGDGLPGSGTPSVDPNTGVPLIGGGLLPLDTDGDGTRDALDLDSDGDGAFDLLEAGVTGTDTSPRDGVLDTMTDSNGNGLDDSLEGVVLSLPDSDGDGTPDISDATAGGEQPLQTGLSGVGGCTLGSGGAVDPLLPLLVMMALAYLGLGSSKRPEVKMKDASLTHLALMPLLVSGLLLISQPLNAEPNRTENPWYAGVGLGLSRLDPDRNGSLYEVDDKSSEGFKLTLGYDWSERISFEGYYSDLGEAGMSPQGEVSYKDLGASGLYYFYQQQDDRHKGLEAFIKAGLGWMKNDSDLPYERVHNSHVMFGLGGAYTFDNGLSLRADLDLYDKDSQFFILSVMQRFGSTSEE
jgi:hypothetical protein